MARRYRRKAYRRPRRTRRRRSVAHKALRLARTVSYKMAGEVKKMDNNQLVSATAFTQMTPGSSTSLADFALLYSVFGNAGAVQGFEIDDFIGNQVRAKYLYLGIHLQSITNNGA